MDIYNQLDNKNIINEINVVFYDKVYDHPWMSLYFRDVKKEHIVSQQTDFIIGAIGGPKRFGGRLPSNAHTHMMITEELFELRQDLLKQAFNELNAPQFLVEAWLKIDYAFKKVIVKFSVSECEGRWKTDPILNFPNPNLKKIA
jgi:hemoglobin